MILNKFPHFKQNNASDCGPTCLRIIAKYYGFNYSSEFLRRLCHISKGGVNLFEIKQAAESVGFNAVGVKLTFEQLVERKSFPCILYWNQRHFVVCYDIVKKVREKYRIKISDPASQRLSYTKKDFLSCWTGENLDENKLGVVLLLEPKEDYNYEEDKFNHKKRSLLSYLKYFNPYSLMIWQLLLSMLVGSVLQIIPPFLSQAVVDQGINAKDTDVILYILFAQFFFFISTLSIEYVRSWILIHINYRIDISLIADFLVKLTAMPLQFFDSRLTGDILP